MIEVYLNGETTVIFIFLDEIKGLHHQFLPSQWTGSYNDLFIYLFFFIFFCARMSPSQRVVEDRGNPQRPTSLHVIHETTAAPTEINYF